MKSAFADTLIQNRWKRVRVRESRACANLMKFVSTNTRGNVLIFIYFFRALLHFKHTIRQASSRLDYTEKKNLHFRRIIYSVLFTVYPHSLNLLDWKSGCIFTQTIVKILPLENAKANASLKLRADSGIVWASLSLGSEQICSCAILKLDSFFSIEWKYSRGDSDFIKNHSNNSEFEWVRWSLHFSSDISPQET